MKINWLYQIIYLYYSVEGIRINSHELENRWLANHLIFWG